MSAGTDVIAVIGAGAMGRGIAQTLAGAGYTVRIFDQNPEAAEEGAAFAIKMLARAAEKGALTRNDSEAAQARIAVIGDLKELSEAEMAIEAVAEDLSVKQALFVKLEQVLPADAVLATNTSSLSVSAVASALSDPSRAVGMHFFNPVPLMRVVEVIPGLRTGSRARAAALHVAERIGYRPILCRDSPGFLINHAGRGLITEGVRIVEEGFADAADVDRVMRDACGFRMGPFELMDLTGLDISLAVMERIYDQFHQEPRYRPGAGLAARVAARLLGRKTGEGFYNFQDGQREEPPEDVPKAEPPASVWAPPEMRGDLAEASKLLEEGGVMISASERAPEEGITLVAPWGKDATSTAVALELDPVRVIAVDPFTVSRPRLTLMGTPATDPTLLDGARAAFVQAGRKVTMTKDSPGFIAQRVLAMIVNIGCEIAQMGIAAPLDIDDGVRIGLGYPEGPLAMGDTIGPERVLAILNAMQQITGDPRYRPSTWLRQRALLGQSLRTADGAGASG
ncbi:MAG: 3-hydroxyacyl-CoA dehydrogenase [Paracoccaceae bacterium]|nr:3-hydroxyacyl-CoA dehydrogenase [Paracoccaceae bacterium]